MRPEQFEGLALHTGPVTGGFANVQTTGLGTEAEIFFDSPPFLVTAF